MIYVILIALIYAFWFLRSKLTFLNKKQQRLVFYIASFLILALVCGFRDSSVGWDMEQYMRKYEQIKSVPLSFILSHLYTFRVECGFALLNKLLGYLFPSPYTIIIFSALLFCAIWGYYFYKNAKDDITEVILFSCGGVYLNEFGFSRQMIATGLLMHAWVMLTKKKYWQSVVLFLVALTFHVTSIAFVLAYLFYFIKENKKATAAVLSVGMICAVFFGPIIQLASSIFTSFSYIGRSDKTLSLGGIWLVWFVEIAIAILFLLHYFLPNKIPSLLKINNHGYDELELCCPPIFVLLYIAFAILGSQFNYIDRFGLFYLPFVIVMLTNFSEVLKQKYPRLHRLYILGLHACFVAYFLFTVTSLDHYHYSFFWQN